MRWCRPGAMLRQGGGSTMNELCSAPPSPGTSLRWPNRVRGVIEHETPVAPVVMAGIARRGAGE
jgi:hypothetical protein